MIRIKQSYDNIRLNKILMLFVLAGLTIAITSIFFLLTIGNQAFAVEYTESEWGIKFQVQDPWNITSNSEKDNLCNNELKCLIVLDNTFEDQLSTITILAEKGQEFENKCQCDSLIEFVQYDYNKTYGSLDDFSLIGDNQTTLNENISAWQMEYSNINKNNDNLINHLVLWTTSNDIFYKISYHGNTDIYSKYLPSLKEFLNSIKFVIPEEEYEKESEEPQLERKLPSFMIANDKNGKKVNDDSNQSIIDEKSDLILQEKKKPETIIDSNNTTNTIESQQQKLLDNEIKNQTLSISDDKIEKVQINDSNFNKYTSEKYKIQFEYPSDWTVTEKTSRFESGMDISIVSPKLGEGIDIMYGDAGFEVDYGSSDLETAIFNSLDTMTSYDYKIEYETIEHPSFITIDNQKTGTFLITIKEKHKEFSPKLAGQQWMTFVGDHGYIIGYRALTSVFDNAENTEIRDHFIKSIKFLDAETSTSTTNSTSRFD